MSNKQAHAQMLAARLTVYYNPNLSIGAKFFFCAITALCEDPHGVGESGQVTASLKKLSELIHCNPGSITRWSKQLQQAGYLTIKKVHLPNSLPINSYSVSTSQN